MKLAQRLLLGAALIVSVLIIVAVVISGERLEGQLQGLTTSQLAREARLVAQQWTFDRDPDALADSAGAALGQRVSLIDSAGVIRGDSEFSGDALRALANVNDRPEIRAARDSGLGSSVRTSALEAERELYTAVPASGGRVVRMAIPTTQLDAIADRARSDVLISGLVALVIALGLAVVFSRQISKPVIELRDVASAIASGDLSRRPGLSGPGEVGELAVAIRRMAEQLEGRLLALEAEDRLQAALVEAMNEGVLAIDGQRRVVRINDSGRELLDADAEVPFSVDLLPRDRVFQDAMADALEGLPVDSVEVQFAGRTLALTAHPLQDGGAVLALFDLTAARRLETMRRDFVANVSHELKTPLTAIRGFAETLALELSTNQQHAQFADTIRANAERMQHLIDDLLDLSRIESGGWRPTPARIDVAEIAGEAIDAYAPAATGKGARILTEIRRDATTVRADPVAMRQVLGNLVENAVRYTPGGGTVTIFSRSEDGGVVLGVRDTGSGISAEHLPRIFERFYRVDAARSRAAGGTGLGLAIVKHLVEAHGGRVGAESRPGRGTTVWMFFPSAS